MANWPESAPARQIFRNGYIAELRRARKSFTCSQCIEEIEKGTLYYSVTKGGGGLGSLKYPDRIHTDCLNLWFNKHPGGD